MNKITDFIREAKVFYLATADGQQPKVRPLGFCTEVDGRTLFAVGTQKEVYQQLLKNPQCEIVAVSKDLHWLRYTGKAVFETDPKYGELVFEAYPHLRKIYIAANATPAVFHLEEVIAEFRNLAGEVEVTIND